MNNFPDFREVSPIASSPTNSMRTLDGRVARVSKPLQVTCRYCLCSDFPKISGWSTNFDLKLAPCVLRFLRMENGLEMTTVKRCLQYRDVYSIEMSTVKRCLQYRDVYSKEMSTV
ncbi:hypothetical protein Btru_067413 [Bulinus truncatus]|nr:hypothetical protein Btru_067413 [Bulinus truncatus]